MINKLFPRILNSSKDSRLRKKNEMKDAYNLRVTNDYDRDYNDAAVDTADGDVGVVKPAQGNAPVGLVNYLDQQVVFRPDTPEATYYRRILGTVVDVKTDIVYLFLYSNYPEEQGVYAYDPSGAYGAGNDEYYPIYRTPEFNFQRDGVVVGDIVHVSGGAEEDFRPILYFTDDVNEPRRLDIFRCLGVEGFNPLAFDYEANSLADKDLITACPKAPVFPPLFEFFQDADRLVSDFRRVPGVQFAYQIVYRTGEVSAISTYSDIAIPEDYLLQGTISGTLDLPQGCRVRIRRFVNGAQAFSDEAERFRLLVRRGNRGPFYEVDEFDVEPQANLTLYEFYNDRVLKAITESEENKQYDNVPRAAQALALSEDRLFYGNYVEGYDEPDFVGTVTPRYVAEGTTPDQTLELTATPVMVPLSHLNSTIGYDGIIAGADILERSPGVAINLSEVPNTIPEGTTINVSFTFNPGGDFSLYTADDSYHNSRLVGADGSYVEAPFGQTFDTSAGGGVGEYYNQQIFSGANKEDYNFQAGPIPARGVNEGVCSQLEWFTTEHVFAVNNNTSEEVVIGTSATTGLKVPAGKYEFAVELLATETIENAPARLGQALGVVLGQEEETDFALDGFQVLASNLNPTSNWDLGFRDPTAEDGDLTNLIHTPDPELGIAVGVNANRQKLNLITPVFRKIPQATGGLGVDLAPLGYIILNAGTVGVRMVHHPVMTEDPNGELVFTLEVSLLSNLDIRTCVPIMTVPNLKIKSWRVFSGEYLSGGDVDDLTITGITDFATTDEELALAGFDLTYLNQNKRPKVLSAAFWDLPGGDGFNPIEDSQFSRRRLIGYLRPTGTSLFNVTSGLYVTNEERRANYTPQGLTSPLVARAQKNAIGTSMFDDEGGWFIERANTNVFFEEAGGVFGLGGNGVADGPFQLTYAPGGGGFAYEGHVGSLTVLTGFFHAPSQPAQQILNFNVLLQEIGSDIADFAIGQTYYGAVFETNEIQAALGTSVDWEMIMSDIDGDPKGRFQRIIGNHFASLPLQNSNIGSFNGTAQWDFDDGELSSEVELLFDGYIQEGGVASYFRSFKTSANHDLGVVYYDDRGRPGNVNLLPSVYVGGYSNEERNEKGRVELEINLESDPPEWAHQYQIVYAGNSTYADFIQYTVGGAYIDERSSDDTARKIYISLNYLQENDQVSYAKAFGAYHPDGSKDMYTFVPGDQLRVVSYTSDDGNQVYPFNLVFDIVDQVLLTGNEEGAPEEGLNPLDSSTGNTPLHLQGSFIVIRDNADRFGWNWTSVQAQGNDYLINGPQSNWGRNCFVELLRPKVNQDPEERVYRETGLVFNVGRGPIPEEFGGIPGQGPQGPYHQAPIIFMRNGDVWWRRVALNRVEYDEDFGYFPSLIPSDGLTEDQDDEVGVDLTATGFRYSPRFRNQYMECRAFTDTFPGANVLGYGKSKFYFPDAAEVRRFSTVTYSDRNDYSRRRLKYSSFNPYQMPFKDLPNRYGAINAMVAFNEYIMILQEDKCSITPINRNILSDASGGNQLISSDLVIGKQKFIPGEYGSDNNREAVLRVDETVYFVHKNKGEVYRYRGGKVEVISRKGISGQVYDIMQDCIATERAIPGATVRVISGYDSLHDEYLVSVMNLFPIPEYEVIEMFTQPALQPFVHDPTSENVNDGTSFEDVGGPGDGVPPAPDGGGGGDPIGDGSGPDEEDDGGGTVDPNDPGGDPDVPGGGGGPDDGGGGVPDDEEDEAGGPGVTPDDPGGGGGDPIGDGGDTPDDVEDEIDSGGVDIGDEDVGSGDPLDDSDPTVEITDDEAADPSGGGGEVTPGDPGSGGGDPIGDGTFEPASGNPIVDDFPGLTLIYLSDYTQNTDLWQPANEYEGNVTTEYNAFVGLKEGCIKFTSDSDTPNANVFRTEVPIQFYAGSDYVMRADVYYSGNSPIWVNIGGPELTGTNGLFYIQPETWTTVTRQGTVWDADSAVWDYLFINFGVHNFAPQTIGYNIPADSFIGLHNVQYGVFEL